MGAPAARSSPRTSGSSPWARTVALPVYIVHQTVGVLCAYAVLRAGVPVAVAAVAIVVTTTAVSVLIAEALRRTPLRAAFGMGRTKGTGPSGAPRPTKAGVVATPAG